MNSPTRSPTPRIQPVLVASLIANLALLFVLLLTVRENLALDERFHRARTSVVTLCALLPEVHPGMERPDLVKIVQDRTLGSQITEYNRRIVVDDLEFRLDPGERFTEVQPSMESLRAVASVKE